MVDIETRIIDQYVKERLSVVQIANLNKCSGYEIDKILRKHRINKRSISDAITCIHITKFGLKEFQIKEDLTEVEKQLKVAGIMLYWGEGTKKGSGVALSNSDPKIIRMYLLFLRNICGISNDRLHLMVHYYQDQDPKALEKFWSEETEIPRSQFYKSHLQIRTRGTYRELSKYGTVAVSYNDMRLRKIMRSWMEEYYLIFSQSISS